ncbi:MAG: HAD family hydrolase [Propioniciclava sp.]|uniref:HAD hydrolase family protein n=1 Tax=Propioniciclava sp. TaxID=2038686 RepID=UPI0039E223E3
MARSVFIDFDGTFSARGQVPPAHVDAVRQARRAGHRVFLCTGRPRALMPPFFLDCFFDGIVCAAGGYVEIDGEVLADVRYPLELARKTASLLIENDATFTLEAPDALSTTPASKERLSGFFEHVHSDGIVDLVVTEVNTSEDVGPFSKATVMHSPIEVATLVEQLGPDIGVVPNSVMGGSVYGGELYLKGITKASGIAIVEKHLGLDRADIIGIGDGMNDLEMIDYAGIGVAVEGAPDDVLAVAQYVIPGPSSNGIAQGFAELGLI